MDDKKKTAQEEAQAENITATPEEKATEKTPEQLADELEEATEKLGGRESLIKRFSAADIQLSRPFEWCGKTYTELHLNFEQLTGLDMEAIDEEIGNMGMRGMVPAYSHMYQRMLAARAAGVPADMIERLPIADYNAVVGAAQNFLFVTG